MNITFLSHYYFPHIGGVERHAMSVAESLQRKGNTVTVMTERYEKALKNEEIENGVRIIRFDYPHIKFFGLLSIWFWLFKNRKLIKDSDIIHIHDVFVWYLPFSFIFPNKPVFTTIHGLEWDNPLNLFSIWQKRIAVKLSKGNIGIGKFLEKYLKVKFNKIMYGGVDLNIKTFSKTKNSIVYVGRLEENTGLSKFLEWLAKNKKYKVDFCGDGPLREKCKNFGEVHGFCNPVSYYEKAKYVVPGGYLAALEALSFGCKLKLFWNSKIKEDYWKCFPNYKKLPTWDDITNEYLNLYNSSK